MNQYKKLTLDDLTGRLLVDLLPVKTIHFHSLFRDDNPLDDEIILEHLDRVLRHRLVYLLTEYGDNHKVLADELDAWRRLVPHRWAEENPKWALVFKTYADTIASAGVVAVTKARHPARKFFLTRWWDNVQRRKLMYRRTQLMRRHEFMLIGD